MTVTPCPRMLLLLVNTSNWSSFFSHTPTSHIIQTVAGRTSNLVGVLCCVLPRPFVCLVVQSNPGSQIKCKLLVLETSRWCPEPGGPTDVLREHILRAFTSVESFNRCNRLLNAADSHLRTSLRSSPTESRSIAIRINSNVCKLTELSLEKSVIVCHQSESGRFKRLVW